MKMKGKRPPPRKAPPKKAPPSIIIPPRTIIPPPSTPPSTPHTTKSSIPKVIYAKNSEFIRNKLYTSIYKNDQESFEQLIRTYNIDNKSLSEFRDDEGHSLLDHAIINGRITLIKWLKSHMDESDFNSFLLKFSPPNKPKYDKRSAIHLAVEQSSPEVWKFIIDDFKSIRSLYYDIEDEGSLLHIAKKSKNDSAFEYLSEIEPSLITKRDSQDLLAYNIK